MNLFLISLIAQFKYDVQSYAICSSSLCSTGFLSVLSIDLLFRLIICSPEGHKGRRELSRWAP